MGRIFETRKTTMFARWNKMAKLFTRISKDIAIAVKSGGTSADSNPALRRALQNARAGNMPKDKVEAAIKRASGQDVKSYDVVLYEGYGPHGIPIMVETATDNVVRTVANVRMHFKDGGGNMGNTGSVNFLFKHMGVFRLNPEGLDQESLELDLIDHGLEEMGEGRERRARSSSSSAARSTTSAGCSTCWRSASWRCCPRSPSTSRSTRWNCPRTRPTRCSRWWMHWNRTKTSRRSFTHWREQ